MLKKMILAASCTLLLAAAGCKREEIAPAKAEPRVAKAASGPCVPYRYVYGTAVAMELTQLVYNCQGEETYCIFPSITTLQSGALSGGTMYLTTHAFDVSEQTALLADGNGRALSMKPAGTTLVRTVFKTQPSMVPGYFTIYVECDYRTCRTRPIP